MATFKSASLQAVEDGNGAGPPFGGHAVRVRSASVDSSGAAVADDQLRWMRIRSDDHPLQLILSTFSWGIGGGSHIRLGLYQPNDGAVEDNNAWEESIVLFPLRLHHYIRWEGANIFPGGEPYWEIRGQTTDPVETYDITAEVVDEDAGAALTNFMLLVV